VISSSNFYVPQVNLSGSLARFVSPTGVQKSTNVGGLDRGRRPGIGMMGLGQTVTDGPLTPVGDFGAALSQGLWQGLAQYYLPWIIGGVLVLVLMARRR
jgi:hypothetical protein